jgi:predicted glycosyltransferase involved in capsule biosynthesis
MHHIPKLSFCITCKNRFHQIREALPVNLSDNFYFKDLIEFIVVEFGRNDGITDWVLNSFTNKLNSRYLAYFFNDELPFWYASIAKNTAHCLASNELLVNLDCDNYTGRFGGKYVIKNFIKHGLNIVHHQFSQYYGDGTYGRIGLTKTFFEQLGGYDESFEPMGFPDVDLILRAQQIGLTYINGYRPQYTAAIVNPKEDKIKYCNKIISYDKMNFRNNEKVQAEY